MAIMYGILLTFTLAYLLQGEVTATLQPQSQQMADHEDEMDIKCRQMGIDPLGGNTAREMHSMFTATKDTSMTMGKKFRRRLLRHMNKEEKTEEDPILDSCRQNVYYCNKTYIYRTANGSCNNLIRPDWGQSNTALRRWRRAEYDDNVASPKITGSSGKPLKSARVISTGLFKANDETPEEKKITHMTMQFAQFLDHDITSTAIHKGVDGSTITCCPEDVQQSARNSGFKDSMLNTRPQCFPITIPKNDARFKKFKRRCMNFVRSVQVPNAKCKTEPAEQLNQITAFIDGSMVYGSTEEETKSIRTLKKGLLKISKGKINLLPRNPVKDCLTSKNPNFCFKAGDERVNEQMGLTSIHTIWMREHNRIAKELARINPHWKTDDEVLFQETRRIVGAMLQHITYAEFLPVVLGKASIDEHNLSPTTGSQCTTLYNETVDPSIRNAFATAAFRFGHSMIRSLFAHNDKTFQNTGCLRLRELFGNTSIVITSEGDAVNTLTRGLVTDTLQSVDRHVTPEVADFLFVDKDGNSFDLMALNIQRGRDHGLPGYNKWRKFCGLSKVSAKKGFDDHPKKVAKVLQELYSNPDEIELFPGGVTEKPVEGGLIGPTFACLVAHQFKALKIGDRFWYETCNTTVRFTEGQLEELHKTSLASVICHTTDTEKIQPNVFRTAKGRNTVTNCNEIPSLNLDKWKETWEWSEWCSWSDCTDGLRKRSRNRICNTQPCKVPRTVEKERECQKCSWSKWNNWSKCIKGCKTRTRTCSCGRQQCDGEDTMFKKCGNWRKWKTPCKP